MVRGDWTNNEGQTKLRGKVGLGLRITCHELRLWLITTNPKRVSTFKAQSPLPEKTFTHKHVQHHTAGTCSEARFKLRLIWLQSHPCGESTLSRQVQLSTGGEAILKDKPSLCMVPHKNYGAITWKLQSKDRIRDNLNYWFFHTQKNNIVMLLKYLCVLNFLNLFTMLLYVVGPKYTPWMNIILGQSFSTRSVMPQLVIVTPTRFLDFNTRTYKKKKF